MPIHDWTRVEAGIFHDFHHEWISEIRRALNRLLPSDYYALAEQVAGGPIADVLTLQHYTRGQEELLYAARASHVAIRHRGGHDVVAIIEIVSPGNKSSRHGLRAFVQKSVELLNRGVHLLVIDLFPPTVRDPQGIHKAIWDEILEEPFFLPDDKPLTLASYVADVLPEGYVEPVGVGETLPDMPVFLMPGKYIPVPLEPTYQRAWDAVPAYWRRVVAGD